MLSKVHVRTEPLLAGFDGVEKNLSGIISYRVDYSAMGAFAVDLMLENSPENWMLPRIHHVSGSGKPIGFANNRKRKDRKE